MGFFGHLFYPWGFVVQIAALVHFFWRRRASFIRLWIIFIGGFVGAAAYFIGEVLAEAVLLRTALERCARKERVSGVEAQILEQPLPRQPRGTGRALLGREGRHEGARGF